MLASVFQQHRRRRRLSSCGSKVASTSRSISADGKAVTASKFVKPGCHATLLALRPGGPFPRVLLSGVGPALVQPGTVLAETGRLGPFMVEEAKFRRLLVPSCRSPTTKGDEEIDQIIAWASADGDTNAVKRCGRRIDFTRDQGQRHRGHQSGQHEDDPLDIPYTRMIWINGTASKLDPDLERRATFRGAPPPDQRRPAGAPVLTYIARRLLIIVPMAIAISFLIYLCARTCRPATPCRAC